MRACEVRAVKIPARQVRIIENRARKIRVFKLHAIHALIRQVTLRTRASGRMDTRIHANLRRSRQANRRRAERQKRCSKGQMSNHHRRYTVSERSAVLKSL